MYNKPNIKTKSNLNSQNENFQTFYFFWLENEKF